MQWIVYALLYSAFFPVLSGHSISVHRNLPHSLLHLHSTPLWVNFTAYSINLLAQTFKYFPTFISPTTLWLFEWLLL